MVRAVKSHSISPSDSSHWILSSISYEPNALTICHGDSEPCLVAKHDVDALGSVEIHKIVGGPRV
jgi:hypothetical protein